MGTKASDRVSVLVSELEAVKDAYFDLGTQAGEIRAAAKELQAAYAKLRMATIHAATMLHVKHPVRLFLVKQVDRMSGLMAQVYELNQKDQDRLGSMYSSRDRQSPLGLEQFCTDYTLRVEQLDPLTPKGKRKGKGKDYDEEDDYEL